MGGDRQAEATHVTISCRIGNVVSLNYGNGCLRCAVIDSYVAVCVVWFCAKIHEWKLGGRKRRSELGVEQQCRSIAVEEIFSFYFCFMF